MNYVIFSVWVLMTQKVEDIRIFTSYVQRRTAAAGLSKQTITRNLKIRSYGSPKTKNRLCDFRKL